MKKIIYAILALFTLSILSCTNQEEEPWRKKLKESEIETIVIKTLEDERFVYQRTYQSDGVDLILIKDKNTKNEYLCVKVTHGCSIVKLEKWHVNSKDYSDTQLIYL